MKYKKIGKYKYQLDEGFKIELPDLPDVKTYWASIVNGTLTIRKGYAWDGASGPTLDSDSSMIASLVHDTLYQFMKLGLLDTKYRIVADKAFKRLLKANGMGSIRANLWYQSVRRFGGLWLKRGKVPKVYEV